MNPRRYALWDDSALGPDLFVEEGGLILSTESAPLPATITITATRTAWILNMLIRMRSSLAFA